MSLLPALSPRITTSRRSRLLFSWRAHELTLAALTGESCTFARAGTGTAVDGLGTTRTLVHSNPRWEMIDWDGDTVREAPHLKLGASGESASWPFTAVPRAMTILVDFTEQGTLASASAGVLYIGNDGASGARLYIDSTGSFYRLTHHNGTSSVTSTLAAAPSSGDRVRLRATIASTGAVQLSQSINSGAEASASASSTLALAAAWGATTLRLNSVGTANVGTNAFQSVRIAAGSFTLAQIQGMS